MRILLVPVIVLAFLHPALAQSCTPTTTTGTWVDTDPLGLGVAPRHYVVYDNMRCPSCTTFFSLWVYEESNGIDGLQREDEFLDTTCHGMVPSDTPVF